MALRAMLRKGKLSLVFCCGLGILSDARAAVPLTLARIGAGPSIIQSPQKNLKTWGSYGAFRFGSYQKRLKIISGLDLTAWRLQDQPKDGLKYDIQGNDVLFFIGYAADSWTFWGALGAGQIRIYDRDAPNEDKPHRSINQVTETGGSYDLYRAQFAKIDASLTWRHMTPEKGWRSAYSMNMIDCLQFEVGFKLLGW